jgi:hypothetical protein
VSEYLGKLGPGGVFWFLLPVAWGGFSLYGAVAQSSMGLALSGAGFIIFGLAAAFRAPPPGLSGMSDSRRQLVRLVLLVVGVLLMVSGGLLR